MVGFIEGPTPQILSSDAGSAAQGVSAIAGPQLARVHSAIAALDGRIDNLDELRRALSLDGTLSAAEVLVHAHERWDDGLLPRLRGEYAFVIWDSRRNRVLAARDPFGVHLLHYAVSKDRILIATDSDQFLTAGLVSGCPDDTMVVEFLTDGSDPAIGAF